MIKLPLQLNLTVDFLNGDPGGGSENVGLGGRGMKIKDLKFKL